jgi:proton glutamate symport protein
MAKIAIHWQILIGMIAGAIIGIALNWGGSQSRRLITTDLPPGLKSVEIIDSSGRAEITLTKPDGTTDVRVIDAGARGPNAYRALDQLKKTDPIAASLYEAHGGSLATKFGFWFQRLGNLFLRMLQMVAVPLIATSLLTGIMGLGAHGNVSRMFTRTVAYYLATSILAIATGIVAVNILRPGLGPQAANIQVDVGGGEKPFVAENVKLSEIFLQQVEALIPANPLAAFVAPQFLSIIAFTILFALFALKVGGDIAKRIHEAAVIGLSVMMAMTTAIIHLAPVGVFFMMAHVTATQGAGIFLLLARYVIAVAVALAFHAFVTLPLILKLTSGRSPLEFARAMSPALLTAFSSASSNGTLPLTIASAEERAGISNRSASFVLPLGSTVNMDGTALYEAVAVLFIAQLHVGANLPLSQQIVVALTALLASIGAAGIPHAGLVMMAIVLQAVGLPLEMQGVILAVDRVLDMARTTVNVWSDCCGCAVIDALESNALVESPGSAAAQ